MFRDRNKLKSRALRLKERPRCRELIIKGGYKPHLESYSEGVFFWDGISMLAPDGVTAFGNSGLAKQAIKMFDEGYWPEVLEQFSPFDKE